MPWVEIEREVDWTRHLNTKPMTPDRAVRLMADHFRSGAMRTVLLPLDSRMRALGLYVLGSGPTTAEQLHGGARVLVSMNAALFVLAGANGAFARSRIGPDPTVIATVLAERSGVSALQVMEGDPSGMLRSSVLRTPPSGHAPYWEDQGTTAIPPTSAMLDVVAARDMFVPTGTESEARQVVTGADVAALLSHLDGQDRERLVVLHLDRDRRLRAVEVPALGGLNRVNATARDVFRGAVLARTPKVVLVHNHPGGEPEPSEPDDDFTTRMRRNAASLGVQMVDHVVIGANGRYWSYAENKADQIHVRKSWLANLLSKAFEQMSLFGSPAPGRVRGHERHLASGAVLFVPAHRTGKPMPSTADGATGSAAPTAKDLTKVRRVLDRMAETARSAIARLDHPRQVNTHRRERMAAHAFGEIEAHERQLRIVERLIAKVDAGVMPTQDDLLFARPQVRWMLQARLPPERDRWDTSDEPETIEGWLAKRGGINERLTDSVWLRYVVQNAAQGGNYTYMRGAELLLAREPRGFGPEKLAWLEQVRDLGRRRKPKPEMGLKSVEDEIRRLKWLHALGATDLATLAAVLHRYVAWRADVGLTSSTPKGPQPIQVDRSRAWDPFHERLARAEAEEARRSEPTTTIPGYFPTPPPVVERMIEAARLEPGEVVLEPSAGHGHIADRLPADVRVQTIELATDNRSVLERKGYDVVASDFMSYEPAERPDKILMNPPFENGQDMEHVQRAYSILKPGGTLVAIMSEGPFFREDRRATAFRDWLEDVDGTSERLPAGTFKRSNTGVNTRMVVIRKPGAAAKSLLWFPRSWFTKSQQLGLFDAATPGRVRPHERHLQDGRVVEVAEHSSGRAPTASADVTWKPGGGFGPGESWIARAGKYELNVAHGSHGWLWAVMQGKRRRASQQRPVSSSEEAKRQAVDAISNVEDTDSRRAAWALDRRKHRDAWERERSAEVVAAAKALLWLPKSWFAKGVVVGPPRSPNRAEFPFVGTIDFRGLQIDVENLRGSTRRGTDKDGHEWAVKMRHHYGEVRRTRGADGDKVDVYVGPDADADNVYVVHQNDPTTGRFDEDKVMLAFPNARAARRAYASQYDRPGFYGGMDVLTLDEFRRFVTDRENFGKRISPKGVLPTDDSAREPGGRFAERGSAGHFRRHLVLYMRAKDVGDHDGSRDAYTRHVRGWHVAKRDGLARARHRLVNARADLVHFDDAPDAAARKAERVVIERAVEAASAEVRRLEARA